MEKLLFIGLLFLLKQTGADKVIYQLTKEEYSRMPQKNHLDTFEKCLNQPGGVYCTAHADVVADGPSELLDMMKGYSADTMKHMNYTNLLYGLCLTRTCRTFYSGDDEAALWNASEACLNHSLSAEYGLKTRVTELNCYFENKSKFEKDWLDYAVVVLAAAILALNFIGTVYDVNRDRTKPRNEFLTAFSVRVNWNQLVAPRPSDPMLDRLKPIYGIRAMTALLVILGHVPMTLLVIVVNPDFIEDRYRDFWYHFAGQGPFIVWSFFFMSGLIFTYNAQMSSDKPMSWKGIPKTIFIRWLRLSPVTIAILLFHSTWFRFTKGPAWEEIIGHEVSDCRNYWYNNLFYINNFFDNSQCLLQTWYLACDMHLHILGTLVLVLAPRGKARWWALGALYAVGMFWSCYNVYTKDLNPILLPSPMKMAEFFNGDPNFNYMFKRTYINLPYFVIGMVFGYIVYDWQQKGVFEKDLRKYRVIYWLLVPIILTIMGLFGVLFYGDGPRASMALRLVLGPIVRMVLLMLLVCIILGDMFKIENLYRGIIEWKGWVPISRLSFCIFSTHVTIIRYLGGTRTTLVHYSTGHLLQEYFGIVVMTVQLSFVLYIFVEAPFARMIKIVLGKQSPRRSMVTEDTPSGKIEKKNNKDE